MDRDWINSPRLCVT